MKRLVVGVLLSILVVALHAQRASALSAGECADLSIHVKDLPEASAARCGSENFGGGGDTGFGRQEVIQIIGVDSVSVISHAAAEGHTYMKRLGVKDVIGNYDAFESTSDWGDESEGSNFAVRRFNAKPGGQRDCGRLLRLRSLCRALRRHQRLPPHHQRVLLQFLRDPADRRPDRCVDGQHRLRLRMRRARPGLALG